MKTNIYLDIDGVVLGKELEAAPYAKEFLNYILDTYPETTYWLTTHCKGDTVQALEHVRYSFDAETFQRLKAIRPTTWDMTKTDGIDFANPFLWFDDDCFDFERKVLQEHGVLDNWIQVDLRNDPKQLLKFVESFPIPIGL